MFVYLPLVSYGTAFLAAYAISSALYVREITGEGQKIRKIRINGKEAAKIPGTAKGKQGGGD